MQGDISIVLTATIVPNGVNVRHNDVFHRRSEYLRAIDYYQPYSDVFFLENSSYDIMSDKDFFKYDNVYVRKFPLSNEPQRGKGYQEFEMLDNWVNTEPHLPCRWIKITGRYFVQNIDKIVDDCINNNRYHLIIEQRLDFKKIAQTYIFYVKSSYYRERFIGAYQYCNDASLKYIEHVIWEKISLFDNFRTFKYMPLISYCCGSTGKEYFVTARDRIKYVIRNSIFKLYNKYRLV